MIFSFEGKVPHTQQAAFVAPGAVLSGDVALAENTSVWYGAVLRADSGPITVGRGSNIQDGAILHCNEGGTVVIGENVTIGHGAVVHGCTVGDGSLIGMHATLLNGCVVGRGCIVGAGALIPEGAVIPDGMLAVGVPARVLRPVSAGQSEDLVHNAEHYIRLAHAHAEAVKQML